MVDFSLTPQQGRSLVMTRTSRLVDSLATLFRRPTGPLGLACLVLILVTSPWVLFFDPIGWPGQGHIVRDPSAIYRLYSDDFAYVAASRTLPRTLANLFVPHNAHIVPAWRVLTWALVAWSGSLVKLPAVLAQAAYGILVAVMLMTARLVARETGRAGLGLAAMAAVGTTSVMASPACWYSAGQTLWAGFGILATLWYAQCWRRGPSIAALVLAAISAALAGWFWTIGYMAGPVAAVYLWLDGRRRCRLAAAVPLCASVLALLAAMALGGGKIDSTVSFHGRTPGEAARPVEGLLHTAQAIPENLVLGNLGLKAQTTPAQGVMISLILLGLWAFHRGRDQGILRVQPAGMRRGGPGAGKLPGRVDCSRLLAVSFPQNNQSGNDRAMVRRRAADRGRSVRRRLVLRPALARQPTGRAATDRSPKPSGGNRGHRFDGGPAGAEPSPGRSALAKLGAPAVARGGEEVPDSRVAVVACPLALARPRGLAAAAPEAAGPGAGGRRPPGDRPRRNPGRAWPAGYAGVAGRLRCRRPARPSRARAADGSGRDSPGACSLRVQGK